MNCWQFFLKANLEVELFSIFGSSLHEIMEFEYINTQKINFSKGDTVLSNNIFKTLQKAFW